MAVPDSMPLDIQWFAYALVQNQALTLSEAVDLYESLPGADLIDYAQAVLNRLAEGLASEEDGEALTGQIEAIIAYAGEQADSFEEPDWEESGLVEDDAQIEQSAPPASSPGVEADVEHIQSSAAVYFAPLDIDYSLINGYEDLPSLSDTPNLSDEELCDRMIYMLSCLRHLGCSDLHISGGAPPFVRRQLEVERIDSYVLSSEDSFRLNTALLDAGRKQTFVDEQDFSYALQVGACRFRVCLMQEKDGYAGSYRLVPDHICSLTELGFMEKDIVYIERLLDYNNGLILVTGPIGAGKTTTLASLVDIINEKRSDHIITVEDPIEILQISRNCQVTQREINHHTINYRNALKAALREDPDVIVVGEMRDLETIENAITAAETGHLVIGTMHTGDAPNTLNRLLDVFPPNQQPQIRAMTAGSLRGVLCQKLIPNGMGGLVLVYEIMLNTMAVANAISDGKAFQLKSTMATANKQGMCTIDQCILEKFLQGLVTYEAALPYMTDAATIEQLNREHAIIEAKKLAEARKQQR